MYKQAFQGEWNEWIRLPQHDQTPSGFIKKPTISQVCQWVKNAWDKVKTETVVLSFKKCGISNDPEGTEDDLLYKGNDSSSSLSQSLPTPYARYMFTSHNRIGTSKY